MDKTREEAKEEEVIRLDFKFQTEPMVELLQPYTVDREAMEEGEDEEDYYTLCHLSGTRKDLLHILYNWVREVRDHAVLVSGDDEYFDYYPENFDIMDTLASQLQDLHLDKMIREARQFAYDVSYHDLEPGIIANEEVEEYEKLRDKGLTEAAATYRQAYFAWLRKSYFS